MSHITYLPAETQPDDLAVPARFQFVLTANDYHLLVKLAAEQGGAIFEFWNALDVATCDSKGVETNMRTFAIMDSDYFLCTIPVSEFIKSDLRPADFNEYLGETQLIPIVYDMIHFIHPTAE
jgi:hypothetical protein